MVVVAVLVMVAVLVVVVVMVVRPSAGGIYKPHGSGWIVGVVCVGRYTLFADRDRHSADARNADDIDFADGCRSIQGML